MKFVSSLSLFVVLTAMNFGDIEGYRILGVFTAPLKSHAIMFEALMKELARKGHQVDVISAFPLTKPHPNYTDIIVLPATSLQLVNRIAYERLIEVMAGITRFIVEDLGNHNCKQLENPEILKLIKNPPTDPPYDLLITQFLTAPCFIALGHHFNVPVIGVSASVLYPWSHRPIANPANLAFVPNNLISYAAPMTFWQRLHNTLHAAYSELYYLYKSSAQDDIIKKYIGENALSSREADRSVALVLVNSHPSLNGPKPTTPAIIEVGGLHIQNDDTELPKDLKDWMDQSTDGFIYFTFGSMVLIETLGPKVIQTIYNSLGKISPVRVLIKIVNPHLLPPGMPKNFRTFKWAPQYHVLKHKNAKAFITHGGLLGTQEAVHCGVPLIGIPFGADQHVNIAQYVKMKIAVALNIADVKEELMDEALQQILHNPLYRNTMREVSERFRDRPMSPMDTATWWVEYVGRHGSSALRSPAMDLTWWQIELLDVYAFILSATILFLCLTIAILRYLVKKLRTMEISKTARTKKMK